MVNMSMSLINGLHAEREEEECHRNRDGVLVSPQTTYHALLEPGPLPEPRRSQQHSEPIIHFPYVLRTHTDTLFYFSHACGVRGHI